LESPISPEARLDARQPPADGEPVALRVERVAPARWETVGDWDQAVAAAARPSVFLTRDWVVAWWRNFGTGLEPLLLRVSDADGRTSGLAPLYVQSRGFGMVCRLGLLGDRVVGSEYLGLVARAGRERAVAGAVAAWLAGAGERWGVAELSGLLEGDPAGAALEWALRPRARRVRSRVHGCSMVPLPRDFDTYLRSLGSGFRQSYRQRSNKLRRTFAVRCYQTEHAADLPEHLERLFQMHNVQWRAKGHTGVFADPRMRAFYLDVSARLLRSGQLRFWQLEVDGVVRASQFGFEYDGVLHSLQEAYDTTFRAPGIGGLGVVLRGSVLQCAIGGGPERLRLPRRRGGVQDALGDQPITSATPSSVRRGCAAAWPGWPWWGPRKRARWRSTTRRRPCSASSASRAPGGAAGCSPAAAAPGGWPPTASPGSPESLQFLWLPVR
jgi:CelD/BcsL family acetyltransferase involved in cellulose biosynthesis